jgi:hypothetical protein
MKSLAIDLGKFKSVACEYDSANGEHAFTTLPMRPEVFSRTADGRRALGNRVADALEY